MNDAIATMRRALLAAAAVLEDRYAVQGRTDGPVRRQPPTRAVRRASAQTHRPLALPVGIPAAKVFAERLVVDPPAGWRLGTLHADDVEFGRSIPVSFRNEIAAFYARRTVDECWTARLGHTMLQIAIVDEDEDERRSAGEPTVAPISSTAFSCLVRRTRSEPTRSPAVLH